MAVVASFAFAGGSTMQHRGVAKSGRVSGDHRMTPRRMISLLTTPIWLFGLLLIATGASMHVVALSVAPLTVVQPVGILAVPISILLAARLRHVAPAKMIWVAVAVTIVGIVGFTVFSTHEAIDADHLRAAGTQARILWGVAAVAAVSALFAAIGWFGPVKWRCIAWSWGGAALYGLGSGFIKMLTTIFTREDPLGHPLVWTCAIGLLSSYAVGAWMIMQAYASGPAEIVVGSMTTVDPLVAVLFGLTALREGAALTFDVGLGMLVFGAIAIGGVVLLSHHHPEVASASDRDSL